MSSRAERYRTFCREAAKELGVKPNSEPAKHVATLRLMREQLQIKLLDGRDVDPDKVLKLDEALRQYMPPAKPLTVSVDICDTFVGICSKCGHEHRPYQPPVEGARPNVEPSPPPPEAPPRPPEPPTNVIEMRPRSIHDGA